ncbi:MAG TPA: glutamate mutase L [Ktedonobacterales bacterium]|nr:glutamate mutase L [Ktedonobacterales bacterium]
MAEATRTANSAPEQAQKRATPAVRSLLMVDCGSVFTKIALIGQVEDRYRLLARAQAATTITPPVADVALGAREAITEIERLTGRTLARNGQLILPEQPDGAGVDAVALATSVGGPLRLLTTGPGREALAALLYRALGGLFVQVESLAQLPQPPYDAETQRTVDQTRALRPHGILVVGGAFGGARGPLAIGASAQTVTRWLDLLFEPEPDNDIPIPDFPGQMTQRRALPVVYTGSPDDVGPLAAAVQGKTPSFQQVGPLSPSPATLTPLNRVVSALYESNALLDVPGIGALRSVASAPPIASITSLSGVVRYLSQHYKMNVVGVDVGANSTALVGATVDGEFLPALHPTAGVGPGVGAILRAVGAPNVMRWLRLTTDENELREYALTRMLRPHMLPTTPRELEMEYAIAREAIRLALHGPGSRLSGLTPLDVALGTGGVFANVANPAQAALILLDALEPRGITSLVLDTAQLASMLGGAGMIAAAAAMQVAESDAVPLPLGPVISTAGDIAEGQPAVRVALAFEDGRQHVEDVAQGTLARLPLGLGERALLSLYPAPDVDVGLGPGQQARASEPIEGGALGLIVDTRGRPLRLPQSSAERIARLTEWSQALGIEAGDGL